MKKEFEGFYLISESDFQELWDNSIFVFDANVLLNLYRYQKDTTEKLLDVLSRLKSRIWIPYHVALEYQRNRLNVIAGQRNKFSDVRNVINKGVKSIKTDLDNLDLRKRHSTIEPETFLSAIDIAASDFIENLNFLENKHFAVTGDDEIRSRLDELFDGKVGPIPENQKVVDDLNNIANKRYSNKIPPGYMDEDKEKSEDNSFSYSGITYQKKYSDYIVWSQLLTYVKSKGIKDIIFVTDDNKEDWWLRVKQNGVKTISPRPELISEIINEGKVERFHMYSSESFLNYANKFISAGVPEETIEEVRDLSLKQENDLSLLSAFSKRQNIYERSIFEWLLSKYSDNNLEIVLSEGVSIIGNQNGFRTGYLVKTFKNPKVINKVLRRIDKTSLEIKERYFLDKIVVVIVASTDYMAHKFFDEIEDGLISNTAICIGTVVFDENSGGIFEFVPITMIEDTL